MAEACFEGKLGAIVHFSDLVSWTKTGQSPSLSFSFLSVVLSWTLYARRVSRVKGPVCDTSALFSPRLSCFSLLLRALFSAHRLMRCDTLLLLSSTFLILLFCISFSLSLLIFSLILSFHFWLTLSSFFLTSKRAFKVLKISEGARSLFL